MTVEGVYEGGCHCGAVRFRIRVREHRATPCNCSICAKKGMINLIVPASDFELLSGEEALASYRFNTRVAEHRFCKTCGIHPFSRPRSHPTDYDVNLRCLDGEAAQAFELEAFDGQHWEANIAKLRGRTL